MINMRGYEIEYSGDGNYLKSQAPDFEGIKSLLRKLELDGTVSVVRKRDGTEIYCGTVSQARFRFGVSN